MSYTGSWHEKEKSSHVAAFLLCLGCGHAVRDAGSFMDEMATLLCAPKTA